METIHIINVFFSLQMKTKFILWMSVGPSISDLSCACYKLVQYEVLKVKSDIGVYQDLYGYVHMTIHYWFICITESIFDIVLKENNLQQLIVC